MRSEGFEPIYWAGTESSLMDIYNFPGVIYAMDCFLQHWSGSRFLLSHTAGGGCCRVGGNVGGGWSGKAEFVAACLTHQDFLDQPIVVLTDSKGLMTVASNLVGKGKDPLLQPDSEEDILAPIIKVLHQRMSMGLFPICIKIRVHRGRRTSRGYRQCSMGWAYHYRITPANLPKCSATSHK